MTLDPTQFPISYTPAELKQAQSMTGELAWLAQRCRPDLTYVVSIMGSLATRDPARVALIGHKALRYLNATKEWKMRYSTGGARALITYTDSSYAPDGEKSHGGAVVFWAGCPIAWKSARQTLMTTSSAETELLEASEGALLMYSIDALLSDVGAKPTERELRVDNSAAITLAADEGGSWRTRHLKVRSGALRQRIQEGWMAINFCPGVDQLADGLTKILASRRMGMLMKAWGMTVPDDPELNERQGQVRSLQAPAQNRQQQDNTTTAAASNLGCCLGLLVLLQGLTGSRASEVPEAPTPLAVDSSLELYGIALMMVICIIALWEAGRVCWRDRSPAARLKAMSAEPRLSKRELRQLNSLLQRDPAELSKEEKADLVQLADAAGVDLRKILQRSSSTSSSSSRPARLWEGLSPSRPTYEDIVEEDERRRREGGEYIPPPPPPPPTCAAADEEFLRRRRMQGSQPTDFHLAPGPVGIWSTSREKRSQPTREVGTQVELLREMPRVVYMTPSGGCVHSTRDCSTLNKSVKYQQRDVCQRCIPGQREHTERPLG